MRSREYAYSPLEKTSQRFKELLMAHLDEGCPKMKIIERNRIYKELSFKVKEVLEKVEMEILLYERI